MKFNFNDIPKPILVGIAFLIGISLFPFIQRPHSQCDSQFEIFKTSTAGYLYPLKTKNGLQSPIHRRLYLDCIRSNSSGGCLEYFNMLKKIHHEMQNMNEECEPLLSEEGNELIEKVISDALTVFVKIAWGNSPPKTIEENKGWLDPSEVTLFCNLKSKYFKLYGQENFDKLKEAIFEGLPGEEKQFYNDPSGERKCLNCDFIKSAKQTMKLQDINKLSLFGTRCSYN